MSDWQPIETAPYDRPFLAAQYAPTNWAYRVVDIDPRRFRNERHRAANLEYCRAWMERPEQPLDKSGQGE